jgi:hypothetical protein
MKNKIYATAPLFFAAFLGTLSGGEKQTTTYGGAFFFEIDALYWKAQQAGLEQFSTTTKSESLVTLDTPTVGIDVTDRTTRLHRPHFDWRWGYRVGAGYYFKDCTWELSLLWTHFDGFAHNQKSEGGLNTNFRWKLNYNVLDFLLTGPQFHLGSSFSWNPFAGVKAAKIDPRIKTISTFSSRNEDPFSDPQFFLDHSTSRHRDRISFYGIGPEAGVKMGWAITKRWSVYANIDGALLYSRYKSKSRDDSTAVLTFLSNVNPPEEDQFISHDETFHDANTCQTVLDVGLGICWQQYECLQDHNTGWIVKLGWDHSQWFDYSFLGIAGDLWLDGLTLSAQLQF